MHTLPLTLYVAMTHCWEQCFNTVPYLMVSAPTKDSGKSVLLELLSFLSHRAEFSTQMSAASMYELIDEKHPSLFLDEFEQYRKSRDHTGIFNGGYRRGACVQRMRSGKLKSFDI